MASNQGYITSQRTDPLDAYFTPESVAYAAMAKLAQLLPDFAPRNVLEPGTGLGVHLDQAMMRFPSVEHTVGVDDFQQGAVSPAHESHLTDFRSWETDERFDLIATNPPFTYSEAFVRKSQELLTGDGLGLFLMRYSIAATIGRWKLWREVKLEHTWIIVPRPPFDEEVPNHTDMCEYAYFIFSRGKPGPAVLDWLIWREKELAFIKGEQNGSR